MPVAMREEFRLKTGGEGSKVREFIIFNEKVMESRFEAELSEIEKLSHFWAIS